MIIKQSPEDFIVKEIPIEDYSTEDFEGTKFKIFELKKTNLNTEECLSIIAKRFKIDSKEIKYSGTKDKHAITTQYISIPKHYRIEDFEDSRLILKKVGFSKEPLSLGNLQGNKFILTVRELTPNQEEQLRSKKSSKEEYEDNTINFVCPNYFDEQRFSSNNFDIGLQILKKDFKIASKHLLESQGKYEQFAKSHLEKYPTDYIGSFKAIPTKTMLMFIHAVQSYIYNEAICEILLTSAQKHNIEYTELTFGNSSTLNKPFRMIFYKNISDYKHIDLEQINLCGFNASIDHHSKIVLDRLRLNQRDFIIRAIPDLSVEGIPRELFIKTNITFEILDERTILEFELGKGSYATTTLKGLFLENYESVK